MYDTIHKISLVTIPHTGTHFVIELLKLVGLEHRSGSKGIGPGSHFNFFHIHWPQKSIIGWDKGGWQEIFANRVMITARDPYLTGIRYVANGMPISEIALHWNSFVEYQSHIDYFAFDIGCKEEDRYEHACDAIRYLNIDPEPYAEQIKAYVDAWAPLNSKPSDLKTKYLETGELPDGYDWSIFDDAVTWYKSLPTNTQV